MEFSVDQIAEILDGTVEGDGKSKIKSFGKIQDAGDGSISFLANEKYEPFLYSTKATAVIISNDLALTDSITPALIRVKDPYAAFSSMLEFYEKTLLNQKNGIEAPVYIHDSSKLGNDCYVGAFAYIGQNCKIGTNAKIYPHVYIGDECKIDDNTIIYSGAKLYAGTQVGKECIIHSGAVIGSDGFGWAPQENGSYKATPQLGHVIIEDNVSIGANTTIDCATFPESATIIKKGAKLDNLIIIAHNVVIGRDTVIAAQTGISGSVEVGNNCVIGGQVGIAGHLKLADKTYIGAQAGVSKTTKDGGPDLWGSPAIDVKNYLNSYAVFKKLPEINRRLSELEKKN